MASLASSVHEIEGVPVPTPASEAQIEALIDRLQKASPRLPPQPTSKKRLGAQRTWSLAHSTLIDIACT